MNTQELLDHCAEVLDDKRAGDSALIDGDPDTLFSDELILRLLNQAQRLHARGAWSIIDEGNPAAGIIVLKTGVLTYPLHKSVLRVYWAKPEDQDSVLSRTRETSLMAPAPIADQLEAFNIESTSTAGRPLGIASDAGTRRIRVFREPSATEAGLRIILKVARLPVTPLSLDNLEAEPEVGEDYHLDLCDYAIGRCLMQPNTDAQSKADGRELLRLFNEVHVPNARRDRERQEAAPERWGFCSTTAVL